LRNVFWDWWRRSNFLRNIFRIGGEGIIFSDIFFGIGGEGIIFSLVTSHVVYLSLFFYMAKNGKKYQISS
jgi:hypothetical protein